MTSLSEGLKPYSSVIVTGGSSGIGKSFIKLIHTLRPEIRFCNLSRTKPATISAELKLNHISVDLAHPTEISKAVDEIISWIESNPSDGGILLVNNSGFGGYGEFPEPVIDHHLEMIDLNIRAMVEMTGRLLPKLQERGGAIINVASTAAFQPTAWMSVYGATKAFVLHWSLALNQELRGTGVHALAVCPGPTATEFFRRAGLQKGSVPDALSMSSDAVVLESLQALVKGRAQLVAGWKNWFGMTLITKLPKPMAAWITAKALHKFRLKKVAR